MHFTMDSRFPVCPRIGKNRKASVLSTLCDQQYVYKIQEYDVDCGESTPHVYTSIYNRVQGLCCTC